jgi:hypothetical protein
VLSIVSCLYIKVSSETGHCKNSAESKAENSTQSTRMLMKQDMRRQTVGTAFHELLLPLYKCHLRKVVNPVISDDPVPYGELERCT